MHRHQQDNLLGPYLCSISRILQRHGVPQKHTLAYHTMIEAIITPSLDSSFIRNPQPLCVAVAQRNPLPFLLKRESLALASSPDVLPE